MVSFPIPDKQSPIRYQDIICRDRNMGVLVSSLTGGRVKPTYGAHLDPDLDFSALRRHPDWRPVLGQTGTAQGHLAKQGIGIGDVFLFFGLFRKIVDLEGELRWDKSEPLQHVIWGWLQIAEVISVDHCNRSSYPWVQYHPHMHRAKDRRNTIYVAADRFTLHGKYSDLPGAGIFPYWIPHLRLTDPESTRPSRWRLPTWFRPRNGNVPLTYHSRITRWTPMEECSQLDCVTRGQEFVLDSRQFPEAIGWLQGLIAHWSGHQSKVAQ